MHEPLNLSVVAPARSISKTPATLRSSALKLTHNAVQQAFCAVCDHSRYFVGRRYPRTSSDHGHIWKSSSDGVVSQLPGSSDLVTGTNDLVNKGVVVDLSVRGRSPAWVEMRDPRHGGDSGSRGRGRSGSRKRQDVSCLGTLLIP